MGSTTPETTTKFEFYDLEDTRGLIFNKVTGEMTYKTIRPEPLNTNENMTITLQNSGYPYSNPFEIKQK